MANGDNDLSVLEPEGFALAPADERDLVALETAPQRPIFQPTATAEAPVTAPQRPIFQPGAPAVQALSRPIFQPVAEPSPEAAARQQAWQWASLGGGAPRAELVKLPPLSPAGVAAGQAQQFALNQQAGAQARDAAAAAAADQAQASVNSPPGLLEMGSDLSRKLLGNFESLYGLPIVEGTDTDHLTVDNAVNAMVPEPALGTPAVSPEAAVTGTQLQSTRDALKADLLRADPNTRAQMLSAYMPYATLDPNTGALKSIDTTALNDSLDRLSDPAYQASKAETRAAFRAKVQADLAGDPRLQGTRVGNIISQVAALPAYASAANPLIAPVGLPLIFGRIFSDSRQQAAELHPDWNDEQLDHAAASAAIIQTAGAEAGGRIIGAGLSPLLRNLRGNYLQRALVQAPATGLAQAGVGAGTQALTNIALGQPVGEGIVEAALGQGIVGTAAGAVHAIPRPPLAPEVATGPSGARVRGPEEATLEAGQVQAEQPPPPPPQPEVQPPPVEQAPPPVSAPAPSEPRPLTPVDVLGPEPPTEIKPEQAEDVLNVVAHNVFPDLNEQEAKQLADRVALLSTRNLETERFRYELQKFLPPDVPYPFGPTTRLMQAYNAFREGPTAPTALELQRAQDAFNAVAGPRAPAPGALKLPIMWREVEARFPEVLPPPVPVTQEDVARRTYEIAQERVRTGAAGDALNDWVQAQQELSRATEPILPASLSEAEPINSAIANRYTAERMARGELGVIDPSLGKSTEELVQQGLQMSRTQRDGLIDSFMKGKGGDLDQQGAAIRSKEAILSEQNKVASRAVAADPANQQLQAQAKAALDVVTAFHNGPVKQFKRIWSNSGRVLQQEIPLDYTTLNGLKEAYLKGNNKEAPPGLEPKLKQMAEAVSKTADAERTAMNNLGKEIEKQTRRKILPTDDQVRVRLMEIMKDLPCPR